ncbi:MAG: electron transfer flavoprotein subunit beta/FixA family protein [Kiritimatiellae bacterium]|nr:electron transfer flavoprotein subunit beta/FixA family protein [Kiritimatiellia bacterium]MBR1836885.1 electron transfer flavoprotein subunit beta/FixA family protein [Kiritimatiellia bacterium]
MKIAVCMKQVPDSDKVTIDRTTNRLNRAGVPAVVNPFDENALELALKLKASEPGSTVTAITMGPPPAAEVVKTAVAHGADGGVLVCGREFGGADTWATGYTIALAIKKLEAENGPFDIVLFGKQATDGDTAQVGPGIANNLGLPCLTYAKSCEVLDEKTFKVVRMTEDGYEEWEVARPCALTVVKEAGELRIANLRGKMKAKSYQPPVWGVEDLAPDPECIGLKGSPTRVAKVFAPPVKANKQVFSGTPAEQAAALVGKLAERHLV